MPDPWPMINLKKMQETYGCISWVYNEILQKIILVVLSFLKDCLSFVFRFIMGYFFVNQSSPQAQDFQLGQPRPDASAMVNRALSVP